MYFVLFLYISLQSETTIKLNNMRYEMTLLSKGIKVTKVCKNNSEVYKFERDMPAKYNLLFSKTPYIIGKKYIYEN